MYWNSLFFNQIPYYKTIMFWHKPLLFSSFQSFFLSIFWEICSNKGSDLTLKWSFFLILWTEDLKWNQKGFVTLFIILFLSMVFDMCTFCIESWLAYCILFYTWTTRPPQPLWSFFKGNQRDTMHFSNILFQCQDVCTSAQLSSAIKVTADM